MSTMGNGSWSKAWVSLLALVVTLVLAPVAASAEEVILQLEWTPNTNHTGIYVALDKGWYQEAGLDVRVIAPGIDTNVLAVVASGRAHFGISAQEYVTSARVEGVPIVSVAAILQHNTSGFASIDRGIKTAADFEGKRYGGWGYPIERAILQGMMQKDGASVDRVRFVTIPEGIDLLTLLRRDIDFTWIYYGWQGIEAELRGVELDIVMMSDYFDAVPDYYTPVLVTSEGLIEQDPDLVRAFVGATAKGYEYAARHPEEAAEILLKYAPENDPELVRRSQEWLSPKYIEDVPRFGEQKLEVWQAFGDWMYENGLISQPFDAAAAFTNEFLP